MLGEFDQLLDLLITEHSGSVVGDHHQFDILIAGFHDIQQGFDHQLQSFFVGQVILVVLLKELAHLLGVAAAGLGFPF